MALSVERPFPGIGGSQGWFLDSLRRVRFGQHRAGPTFLLQLSIFHHYPFLLSPAPVCFVNV